MNKQPNVKEILVCLPVALGYVALIPRLVLDLAAAVGLPLGLGYWTCLGALYALRLVLGTIKPQSAKTRYQAGDLYYLVTNRILHIALAAILIYWVL